MSIIGLLLEGMESTIDKNFPLEHRNEVSSPLEDYRRQKAFPHIADYYNFRINNRILLSKIINPRRDKTIMESLPHPHPKYSFSKQKPTGRTKLTLRKNNSSTFSHFGKTQDQPEREGKNYTRHTSKTSQRMKTLKADQTEGQKELEEYIKRKREGIANDSKSSTFEHSVRNNFLGKIVRNLGKGAFELSQTVMNCDLSVSCAGPTGIICRNGLPETCTGVVKGKIKRVHRPQLSRQWQEKQNFSLRVQDCP